MKRYIKSSRAIQDERIDYLLSNGWEMGYGTSPMNRATEVYFKEFTDPESGKYVRVVINPSDYFQVSAGYSDGWKAKFDDNVPSHLHRGRYRDELSVIEKAAQDALNEWKNGSDDVMASAGSSVYEIATIYSGPFGSAPSEADVISTYVGYPYGESGHYRDFDRAFDAFKSSQFDGDQSWVEETNRGYTGYVTVLRKGDNILYYKGYDGQIYKMFDSLPD
jgi:hypothetical protein